MIGLNSVYRHFNKEGILLYVGCTSNIAGRCYQHALYSKWAAEIHLITVEHFPTRFAALNAELNAIKNENPLWNVNAEDKKKEDQAKRKARLKAKEEYKKEMEYIISELKLLPNLKKFARKLRIPVHYLREIINGECYAHYEINELRKHFKSLKK